MDPNLEIFGISCADGTGIESFLDALTATVHRRLAGNDDSTTANNLHQEGAIITRTRHRRHILSAAQALVKFENLSTQGFWAVDLAAEELRLAATELGRVVGAVDVEEVLDVLFADFCIGK